MSDHEVTAADAGCWFDGHWGHYNIPRLVELAISYGMPEDEELRDLLDRYEDHYWEEDYPHEVLMDAAEDAEQWLNDNVAPEGHHFGWYDGEFFLWADETWEEES